jgi:hypothetical protein
VSRYRLQPTPIQQQVLLGHCAHARYAWNLAVEQHRHWRPGRKSAPGYPEQCRQLTQVRAEHEWLREGSQMVQQQALRACVACNFACNADVNAARSIAAGHAVTARGRSPLGGRVNREPQPVFLSA